MLPSYHLITSHLQGVYHKKGVNALSEEKKNLIRDVTARIDKLPEDKKHYILGYMDGVIDCSTDDSGKEQKESS
nr:MAG TPA: hypothetical protein [Caudoviricetes sp.]